jgi:hypothetical protein
MNTDNKYLLFLIYDSDKNTYAPRGVTYGKVPLDTDSSQLLDADGTNTDSASIIKAAQKLYKDK